MSNMGPTHPASPDEGFPNPHSPDFQGERTPEEQYEFEQQEARRNAAAGNTAPASGDTLASGQASPDDLANRAPGA